ncbi:hypothetical protein K438DRAFT_1784888 [Mycena galopus ATCC 62051]|nr:hypothetical protein K438DRAFT_1784888 [Mycena galopus ATCC 62051]
MSVNLLRNRNPNGRHNGRSFHNVGIERLWVDVTVQEEEDLGKDELEVYGIDWQGLRGNNILHSQAQNNSTTEGSSSWVGHTGPPPDLSQVIVQPPVGTLTEEEATDLYNSFSHLIGSAEDGDIILLWSQALAHLITVPKARITNFRFGRFFIPVKELFISRSVLHRLS